MAIVSLDGALAGMQPTWPFIKGTTVLGVGRPCSTWYATGSPASGLIPSVSTSGGVALTCGTSYAANVAGQMPRIDPGSGNSYLGRFAALAVNAGLLFLCDRLHHTGAVTAGTAIGLTTTTAQVINTSALPARDNTGTTNGVGVFAGFEIQATAGAGTPTLTISYTNSGGTGNRVATNFDAVVASSAVGTFYRFGLQAGDVGIQSVQSITINATMTSGAGALVLYRVLAVLELGAGYVPNAIDALTAGFPQIFNGTVPFMIFISNTAAAQNISGAYTETQG